ncbi:MAG: sodium:proton antiporter [Oscillospiraceae bacterium]|nr:sodium:proton antiporter [Oscillospiraceae bacterium]
MTYASLTHALYTFVIAVLSLGSLACLLRAILGPSTADRLVAVNMTGTQVICLICILAARSGEYSFADVAVIYALLSFLAVAVLTKILTERNRKK